ncbi:MAG TPA: hypothetical protein VEB69_04660 [Acidimicrobiia bacterium]|nr:hypothetical protein [Acidimicrobiia bacterium]
MSEQTQSTTETRPIRTGGFSLRAWVLANAIGLGLTYGLFALLGDLAEYGLGVAHDSLVRNLAMLVAVIVGASTFMFLRQRVLASHITNSRFVALAAAAGLTLGLIVGFAVGGPPIDFVLGAIALGTIGGTFQWRALRDRVEHPGRLLAASIGGWVLGGIAGGAVAFSGDALHALFGAPEDGTAMGTVFFVFILTLIGVVGGAVGGWVEGTALRRRLG